MPGLTGGDGFGGERGEVFGIRGDANAPEIHPVGIEADGEGEVGLGHAAVVDAAGGMGKRDWRLGIGDFQEVEEAEVDGWFFHRLRSGTNASLSELCGFVKGA